MYDLDTGLLELLPPWYREILDYQALCAAEGAQLDALAEELAAVRDNCFFQTMGEGGVAQWEQIFRIVPNPAAESLEFRRTRVLNRISTRPPYTLGFLYQKLDELIGKDAWTVRVDYPGYTLYVESSAENQLFAHEVAVTVNRIKPAHIVFVNVPYVKSVLRLGETVELSQRVYQYRLGAWGLGLGPFALEESLGVIKMPSTPSIQSALLEGTANFAAGDVAAARVNGSIVISGLDKSVEGSTLSVRYQVTPEQTQAVTSLELLDAAGEALTASAVYVPVESGTLFKHVIQVSEGVN